MSDASAIEWTDSTWNPVRGCTKVSAGCKHCYAETFAKRWRGVKGHPFEQGFDLRLVPEALGLPLRWKKPRRIFVNSMSDLFHEDVPDEFIAAVFGIMSICTQHTFQVLTKRAARARRWFEWMEEESANSPAHRMWRAICEGPAVGGYPEAWEGEDGSPVSDAWPLPNVWLGVSVEDQAAANERIPDLLATPAAVRFLSCEPLLGPVDLDDIVVRETTGGEWHFSSLCPDVEPEDDESFHGANVDWVILGGESGPGARACDVAWIRSLVKQCRTAGVPAFVKQLGARVEDRNDAGFMGEDPASWPIQTFEQDLVEHDPSDTGYQGAPVRVRTLSRKGADPTEWPEDLRVREMPL